MINLIKEKVCSQNDCENTFFQFNSLEKYCSAECKMKDCKPIEKKQRKRICQVSKKQQKLNLKYSKIRKEFLSQPENKYCPVFGFRTSEIHHTKGRVGYADDWARQFDVPLMIDERFFLAVSRKGHQRIELNPEWAKQKGYSLNRHNET